MVNEGSINIYVKGNPLPIEDVETYIESYSEDADRIARAVNSVQNKIQAIDALFESIVADLGLIELEHIDDNGKELASSLKRHFQILESEYYWKVIEVEADSESGWMANSYSFMANRLANQKKQNLVVPAFRESYEDVVSGEPLTKEDKENEFQRWLVYIRKQFGLGDDFR